MVDFVVIVSCKLAIYVVVVVAAAASSGVCDHSRKTAQQ
jgi:hypothetical protein